MKIINIPEHYCIQKKLHKKIRQAKREQTTTPAGEARYCAVIQIHKHLRAYTLLLQ